MAQAERHNAIASYIQEETEVPYTKRILCLASSDMPGDRCIAGKELLANSGTGRWHIGGWIRLVSGREKAGLSFQERQYTDGTEPCVFDVMDVPVLNAQPRDYQRENWLIDTEHYWEKVRRVPKNKLERLIDPTSSLWIDGYSSSNGQNDRIPIRLADKVESSLHLIKVDRLELSVYDDYKRQFRGNFRHGGIAYTLSVTDPDYRQAYRQRDGSHLIGECFLTISLSLPYKDGYAYKLIAAIIEP